MCIFSVLVFIRCLRLQSHHHVLAEFILYKKKVSFPKVNTFFFGFLAFMVFKMHINFIYVCRVLAK